MATVTPPATGSHTAASHGGAVTLLAATAATASRSTWRATRPAIASTAALARLPCSTAVTRPRCRDGTVSSSARGMDPSTGTPACSHACRSTSSWRAEPTRLRITPANRTLWSKVANPCSRAAMLWLCPRASTTRITGAPSIAATWAVEPWAGPGAVGLMRPSNRPITPSTTAMSASSLPCRNRGPINESPTRTGSRLRPGRPDASP